MVGFRPSPCILLTALTLCVYRDGQLYEGTVLLRILRHIGVSHTNLSVGSRKGTKLRHNREARAQRNTSNQEWLNLTGYCFTTDRRRAHCGRA